MARFKQKVYDAYEKDAADRTFWEKIQAAYAGPLIEADKEKNKGSSVLSKDYQDIVDDLKEHDFEGKFNIEGREFLAKLKRK